MAVERMGIPLTSQLAIRDRAMPTSSSDGYLYNAYVDKDANGQLYVKKRPALVSAYAPSVSTPYGLMWWNRTSNLLHVWGTTLYYGTATSLGTLTSNAGRVSFCEYGYGATNGDYVYILTNGPTSGQLWRAWYTGPTLAAVGGFGLSNIVPGLVAIDGYMLVCSVSGGLYNSNLGDPTTWVGSNIIYAGQKSDTAVYLASHHNHAVIMGKSSIEFFYNAGIATGSPFQRRSDVFINTGCHHPDSVAQDEDKIFFIAKSDNSDPYVAVLDNFQVRRISTAEIDRKLHKYYVDYTSDTCVGTILQSGGKRFYVLSIVVDTSDTADGTLKTFVYDIDLGIWAVWAGAQDAHLKITGTAFPTRPDYGQSASLTWTKGSYVQADLTYKAIYYPATEVYQDSISGSTSNFTVEVVTPKVLGPAGYGHRRKFLSELNLTGKRTSGTVDISYSDDDYASWTSAGSLQVNAEKKLSGLGSFYERAFKITATTNEDLRIAELEAAMEYGRR